MAKGTLFKWEDSATLRHHCGFCDKPMSHPSARNSCFGTHAEPCHRYHQMMFMRLRGHTCNYCITIDNAHHDRHKVLAGQLRQIFETAGEPNWTIIPTDSAQLELDDLATVHDLSSSSRRERKDAKNLVRAANRAKVVTREEILYIDSMIHTTEGAIAGESASPDSPEEIEDIERHLKYNAHVYNSRRSGWTLKSFSQLPEVDIDFDIEVERVLEALRVTELAKRNTRSLGLQGKALTTFDKLVEDFRKSVVDDLVRVKMDILEIKMRRAGFLRYTNKTGFSVIEHRYTDKDWKTGEKHTSDSSDYSDLASTGGAVSPPEDEALNSPEIPPGNTSGPDRRHLEKQHKRVTGDDGLGQSVVDPYHTPLLPMPTAKVDRKPAAQLRVVVDTNTTTLKFASNKPSTKTERRLAGDSWSTVLSNRKPKAPSVKPAWGMTMSGQFIAPSLPPVNPWGKGATEIPDLRDLRRDSHTNTAAAVRSPAQTDVTTAKGPEQALLSHPSRKEEGTVEQPIISQKKMKKQEREAKRKNKKQGAAEPLTDSTVSIKEDVEQVAATTLTIQPADKDDASVPEGNPRTVSRTLTNQITTIHTTPTIASEPIEEPRTPSTMPSSPTVSAGFEPPVLPIIHTSSGSKHIHWLRFERGFVVDKLTGPWLENLDGQRCGVGDGTPCAYEANSVKDCPFHEPYCLHCKDPWRTRCFLAYPSKEEVIPSCGPFNLLHGKNLLAKYQEHHDLKDRLMLVDEDLLSCFLKDPAQSTFNLPPRLAAEFDDFAKGCVPGPCMEQQRHFERLAQKNTMLRRKVTQATLTKAHDQVHKDLGNGFFCYCQEVMPKKGLPGGVVECAYVCCTARYFHTSCVKDLGLDKRSKWYCRDCEYMMRKRASVALGVRTIADILKGDVNGLVPNADIPEQLLREVRAQLDQTGSKYNLNGFQLSAAVAIAVRSARNDFGNMEEGDYRAWMGYM